MTTTLNPPTSAPPAQSFRPHRMTVDRYCRMVAAGVYNEKDPVFLWKGQLVEKMTKNAPHDNAVALLGDLLRLAVPEGWHVRQDSPIILRDESMPEPDFIVLRGTVRDYLDRRPNSRDVGLVIEVSDSSLAVDSHEVLEVYAQNALPVYWLVNLPHRRIEVYTNPVGALFVETKFYRPNDEVPLVLDGSEVGRIAVRDVLP